MSTRKFLLIIFAVCIITSVVSFFSTLYFVNKKNQSELQANDEVLGEPILKTASDENKETVLVTTNSKITPSTKMVYQYYYPKDDVMEQQEDIPPYFLLDLTFEDMKKLYNNWQVISFSEKEVVLRKMVEGESEQHYVVGQQDGYIAVFYAKEKSGINLHEITSTPISSLSKGEQERLNEGIPVIGDEQLSKILEDYGS